MFGNASICEVPEDILNISKTVSSKYSEEHSNPIVSCLSEKYSVHWKSIFSKSEE